MHKPPHPAANIRFYRHIHQAINDSNLQQSLAAVKDKFISHRANAIKIYEQNGGDFESLRQRGKEIRDAGIRQMPVLLRQFEDNAQRAGANVLWAKDAASARRLIIDIARRHQVKTIVKSKSMTSEEIKLNDALNQAGVEVTETDLGEFIIQLNNETPSHIIAPAMHKRRAEVAAIMRDTVDIEDENSIVSLTRAARAHLRRKFLEADMGISGANFLIADTGSSLIVTNEGNGRMTTTLPRVHITLAGIDKIVAHWHDIPDLLALLTRSATGQRLTNYVSVTTGNRRYENEETSIYIVLLDNGRSQLRQSEFHEMLRCIRCGACMNHCPVYHTVGGHAYNSTYMGPMGQILTPTLKGLNAAADLPFMATMCGACSVACPVKIPLPDLMRRLRKQQALLRARPPFESMSIRLWAFISRHPTLYILITALTRKMLTLLGGAKKKITWLPGNPWFAYRDLPTPAKRDFYSPPKQPHS